MATNISTQVTEEALSLDTLPPINLDGKVKLLHMILTQRSGQGAVLVIPPFLAWVHSNSGASGSLLPWLAVMVLLAAHLVWIRRQFLKDYGTLPKQELLDRWTATMHTSALLYGFSWSLPVLLTVQNPSFEFSILLYVILIADTAAAATYISAMVSIFYRLWFGTWLVPLAAACWMFPSYWQALLPTLAIFCFFVLRHAQSTHRFLVRQIQLEEYSHSLAEKFKTAQTAAEQALDEKNSFLSTASHDLRQPVHAMALLVEAIALRGKEAALKPLLVDLKHCMESMGIMFNALLDLSKLEAGAVQVRSERVDLHALLRQVSILFKQQANSRNLALRIHLPRGQADALGDPTLVLQVIANLINNALRYTEKGGVLLGVRRRASHWQIEVSDTGVGMNAQEAGLVFSPYHRNAHALRTDAVGYGLGLAVMARCAVLMGAAYGVESRLGKGSKFWIKVPIAPNASVCIHHAPAPFTAQRSTNLHRLAGTCLILEDDALVNAAWSALLAEWGVDARFATRAHEALAHVDAGFRPQVILCDERLRSGESGFAVLQTLLERCPLARGAMVSGEFNSTHLAQAESEGYLVLRKPFDVAQLHGLLATWFATQA